MATKKQVYAKYGIQYKSGKVYHSKFGWVPELLKEGNTKTGKAVYTWSTLPGTAEYPLVIDNVDLTVRGTCVCDCVGCYATAGFYRMDNVIESMAKNTYLVNTDLDFVRRAISAQLEILGRGEIRIHASGDFNTADPDAYATMWHDIAGSNASFRFWTYTKIRRFEPLFDDLKNANIVKSIIPHVGVNFGRCEYIISAYYTLLSMGMRVYICRCGIDKNQHCERCGICATYDYVLFLEHSTGYKAEEDPLFPKLCEIVNAQ